MGVNNFFGLNGGGVVQVPFTPLNEQVTQVRAFSNGNAIAYGYFTGTDRNRLMVFNPLTREVTTNVAGLNNIVSQLVAFDEGSNTTLPVGNFTTAGGNTVNYGALIDGDGQVLSFPASGGFNGSTRSALFVPGSYPFYIGGGFTAYNGAAKNQLVNVDGNMNVNPSFNVGAGTGGGSIYSMAYTSRDDFILLGGNFTSFAGVSRNQLVAINRYTGAVITSFNPGSGINATYPHRILTVGDPDIATEFMVAGSFTTYQGFGGKGGLVKLTNTGSAIATFPKDGGFSGASMAVTALSYRFSDNTLFVGGRFTSYGGTQVATNIAHIHSSTGDLQPNVFGTGFNDLVWDIDQLPDGNLLVGGRFTTYNGQATNYLAVIDPVTGALVTAF